MGEIVKVVIYVFAVLAVADRVYTSYSSQTSQAAISAEEHD